LSVRGARRTEVAYGKAEIGAEGIAELVGVAVACATVLATDAANGAFRGTVARGLAAVHAELADLAVRSFAPPDARIGFAADIAAQGTGLAVFVRRTRGRTHGRPVGHGYAGGRGALRIESADGPDGARPIAPASGFGAAACEQERTQGEYEAEQRHGHGYASNSWAGKQETGHDVPMSHPTIARWHDLIRNNDVALLDDLLADDAVFESPVIYKPQLGMALTRMYLTAAAKLLNNGTFRYLNEWVTERSAVLEFESVVNGVTINGVDMIFWNEAGQITRFKVMVRPKKGMDVLQEAMMQLLAEATKG
jgi:hypothetical protein